MIWVDTWWHQRRDISAETKLVSACMNHVYDDYDEYGDDDDNHTCHFLLSPD